MNHLRQIQVLAAIVFSLFARGVLANSFIVHSNDVMGEIEPCGCRTRPNGGFSRKANFLKKIGNQTKSEAGQVSASKDYLQIDAGDLLFPTAVIPNLLKSQSLLQAKYVVQAMEKLSHNILVPGEKDFALGLNEFKNLFDKSRIQILAANLKSPAEPNLFKSHVVLPVNGGNDKVGIIGVVGEELKWPTELKVASSLETARSEVKELRKSVKWIVVVTHQSIEKDRQLAESVSGIDFVIGGHSQHFLQEPEKINNTFLFQSSFKNQYIGVIPLVTPFLAGGYQLVALDESFSSPPDSQNEIDPMVSEFKEKIAEVNSSKNSGISNEASMHNQKYQTFPQCAECHLKQFDFWRRTPHVKALQALFEKKQDKNKECLACHSLGLGEAEGYGAQELGALAVLRNSPSFEEFPSRTPASIPIVTSDLVKYLQSVGSAKSLESRLKTKNPHFYKKTIVQSLSAVAKAWVPVQCENCHGAGYDHPRTSEILYSRSKPVEAKRCLDCHTPERAPGWYNASNTLDLKKFEAKRIVVACPKGD